jgi:hypothetical protein
MSKVNGHMKLPSITFIVVLCWQRSLIGPVWSEDVSSQPSNLIRRILYSNTHRNTVRGGWVEFQEFDLQYYSEDGSLKPDSSLATWIGLIIQASNQRGRDPCPGPKLENWVRDAGFVEIQHQTLKLPIGPWPKDAYLVRSLFHLVFRDM